MDIIEKYFALQYVAEIISLIASCILFVVVLIWLIVNVYKEEKQKREIEKLAKKSKVENNP